MGNSRAVITERIRALVAAGLHYSEAIRVAYEEARAVGVVTPEVQKKRGRPRKAF